MTKIAYVFPGQGSQSVGMLSDVADAYPVVGESFSHASELLGYDLWELVQNDPEEKLNQTEFTQPALLCASIALWRVALAQGARQPDIVAGHSLGEYSALVAAGVLEFSDAISLVQKRGQFMQTAVPVGLGSMTAVLGLDDANVKSICEQLSTDTELVQAANFNAPGQVVISGHNAALEKVQPALKEAGARKVIPLAVSAPFHSALMQPAADKMATELEKVSLNRPVIRIIQNVNAEYESDPDNIRANLVSQMHGAVLWTSTIENLARDGVEIIVECGPGKVLSSLNKRISKTLQSFSINSVESLQSTITGLSE
ncbi:MAG TPA: ACP S-malonyltransferase [Gammaproteobacteria bacterium]|nr:ACP S-malonyltransferase [Gammaproteobacteria bacterium]HIL97140.1 [acyl-carrier-protein] S-malonyltransferase [Pseudomonadales bacterium]